MLDDYYKFRGCDPETGLPKEVKLKELGLDFVVKELKPKGLTK
jgi:aldehyde:ferredoxin oxidoreductase